MILRGNSLEKKNKPRMREIKYSPWEDTIPIQDDEDFLVIDNKFWFSIFYCKNIHKLNNSE